MYNVNIYTNSCRNMLLYSNLATFSEKRSLPLPSDWMNQWKEKMAVYYFRLSYLALLFAGTNCWYTSVQSVSHLHLSVFDIRIVPDGFLLHKCFRVSLSWAQFIQYKPGLFLVKKLLQTYRLLGYQQFVTISFLFHSSITDHVPLF